MSLSRSLLVCRICNRNLPRAASRCPWCKTPLNHSLTANLWLAGKTAHGQHAGRSLLYEGEGR